MADIIKYKDYQATVHYSSEDEVFFGKIMGISDLVTFEGSSVQELKNAFKDAMEDYLQTCKALNKAPEKMYKGSFNVRVSKELHRTAAFTAANSNLTLNDFVNLALKFTLNHQNDFEKETVNVI